MKFTSWKQRAEDRGTSVSTEKRCYANDPTYPRLVHISPGRVAFVARELDEYDAHLIAARDKDWRPRQVASPACERAAVRVRVQNNAPQPVVQRAPAPPAPEPDTAPLNDEIPL